MAHQWPMPPNLPQADYEPPRMAANVPNTIERIRALGNSVVPQDVYPIAYYLHQVLTEETQ